MEDFELQTLSDQIGAVGVRVCSSSEIFPHLAESRPVLVIENAHSTTVVAPDGAHVLAFVPAGKSDLLWLSPQSAMAKGKPIRGGIPLCLPWFGPNPDGHPLHGFGRLAAWSIGEIAVLDDGATRVRFTLGDSDWSRAMWPHAFAFEFEIVAGRELRLTLSARNSGDDDFRFEFAFHSYFDIGKLAETSVSGLDGATCIDRNDGTVTQQSGPVTTTGAIQNLYLDVPASQAIKGSTATIEIVSDASSALIWNCGENDANIADIGKGNHTGYLCVERLDAVDRAVVLKPGASYRTTMTLSRAD